jgi:hypothetical protein
LHGSQRVELVQSDLSHVDSLAAEGDTLRFQESPLACALGKRAVSTHDAVPRKIAGVVSTQHIPGEPWCARGNIAIGAHIPRRDRADPT